MKNKFDLKKKEKVKFEVVLAFIYEKKQKRDKYSYVSKLD